VPEFRQGAFERRQIIRAAVIAIAASMSASAPPVSTAI
jgi:hypothetical protein